MAKISKQLKLQFIIKNTTYLQPKYKFLIYLIITIYNKTNTKIKL